MKGIKIRDDDYKDLVKIKAKAEEKLEKPVSFGSVVHMIFEDISIFKSSEKEKEEVIEKLVERNVKVGDNPGRFGDQP